MPNFRYRNGQCAVSGSKRKAHIPEGRLSKKSKIKSNSQASGLSQECHASQEVAANATDSCSELENTIQDILRRRLLTWLVISPVGLRLPKFSSLLELLRALCNAIKAHHSLLETNILHRDTSKNNIIITDPEKANGNSGMLIDMDMTTRTGPDKVKKAVMLDRFAAIEILESVNHDIQHSYRHDLESCFYVFLSICVNYGWLEMQPTTKNPLQSWYIPPYESIVGLE